LLVADVPRQAPTRFRPFWFKIQVGERLPAPGAPEVGTLTFGGRQEGIMGRRRTRFTFAVAIVLALGATSLAYASSRHHSTAAKSHPEVFTAHLNGYQEVPSDNSPATGTLTLTVGNGQLTWSLTYKGFAANNQPVVAHVHVGQPGVSGSVSFFFCGGPKPACPSSQNGPVTITGTTVPADILGPTSQEFAAGDLNSIVKAMEAGLTYANMHTPTLPAGEIRGQLLGGKHGHGHGDDNDQGDDD
jgi:hypothetical protein